MAIVAIVIAGCGGDDGTTDTTASEPTTVPAVTTTVAPTTSSAASTTIAAPSTTVVSTTSTVACEPTGDTAEQQSADFPGALTSEIGKDIRVGVHDCYDRIVIELQPSDHPFPARSPGYWVRYQDDPVDVGESGEESIDLRGDANLLITVEAWMTTMEATGYLGPTDISVGGDSVIKQLYLTHNFEGVHTWAVGLDRERPFEVTVLSNPTRVVVDIQRQA